MWCPACQQDTPGVASPDDIDAVRCANCGQIFSSSGREAAPGGDPSEAAGALADGDDGSLEEIPFEEIPFDFHDWRLEDDLADAERLIRTLRANATEVDEVSWTPPAASPAMWRDARSADSRPQRKGRSSGAAAFFSWAALALGVMGFVSGAVLLGWSFVTGRSELWSFGLPLTLAGQAGLLIGLILQLEGLWQSSRHTADTLDALDGRLTSLRHTATMLGASSPHAPPSLHLYSPDSPDPQLLLANLKGQMDLLALRLEQERRRVG